MGMEGIIKEGEKHMKTDASDMVIQGLLIGSGQRVEHYEIAGYEDAIMIAQKCQEEEVIKLLKETLKEEEKASETLTMIAEEI
jgi:ferritin-like metal-binding protein YciE